MHEGRYLMLMVLLATIAVLSVFGMTLYDHVTHLQFPL